MGDHRVQTNRMVRDAQSVAAGMGLTSSGPARCRSGHGSADRRGARLPPATQGPPGIYSWSVALEVRPADRSMWDDVCTVMTTTGDSRGCWCQWFHTTSAEWRRRGRDEHRTALCDQLAADPAPGVLGYLDGQPAAWCALGPRTGYQRVRRSRKPAAAGAGGDLDDETIWAVTCFVVRAPFRRRGLSLPLLTGAVGFAAAHGASVVEGYPVDLDRRDRIGAAELYVGALSTFLAAGFTEVGRSAPARPVVRRTLHP